LTHYTSGEPAKTDIAMMRVRQELSTQNWKAFLIPDKMASNKQQL
jgi:hypothetical protein